jgi:hypothetical protein
MTSLFSPDSSLIAKAEVMQHPPHGPDLAPLDFYLFELFKNFSKDLRIKTHFKKQLCNN